MKYVVFLALLSVSAITFSKEIYKWVDENGKVHYSDKKPQSNNHEKSTLSDNDPVDYPVRDEANIRKKFDSAKGKIYALYRKELKNNNSLAGKLVVKYEINGDGRVTSADIIKSELNNPKLEQEIIQEIKKIDFGKGQFRATRISYAFDFLSTSKN